MSIYIKLEKFYIKNVSQKIRRNLKEKFWDPIENVNLRLISNRYRKR